MKLTYVRYRRIIFVTTVISVIFCAQLYVYLCNGIGLEFCDVGLEFLRRRDLLVSDAPLRFSHFRLCLFHLQGSDLHYGISGSTFVLPITCIPISPCSVDIGNSLEGIVTEFEFIQHK